jgi:hypothetical protein
VILLFGLATIRAGVFPRWSGWLQVASFPIFMAFLLVPTRLQDQLMSAGIPELVDVAFLVTFAGYAWAGAVLVQGTGVAQQPPTCIGVAPPVP